MPVHHIEVPEIRAACFGGRRLLSESAEVRGEDRRGDKDAPRSPCFG
jgi:hypothetical protein